MRSKMDQADIGKGAADQLRRECIWAEGLGNHLDQCCFGQVGLVCHEEDVAAAYVEQNGALLKTAGFQPI